MGDAAGQLADGLDLLRLEQGFPGALQRLPGLDPFGDVARHLGEAQKRAVVAADRIDHDMRPEAGPVLAHPQGLGFKPPLAGGDGQSPGGRPRGLIGLCVEGRKMPADDLLGAIALDPLGAEVPGRDPPLGVQHVDGVVDHAFHQQAEFLLALAQGLGRLFPLAQVAGDLGVADQLALGRPDRIDDHMGPEPAAVLANPPPLLLETAFGRGLRQRPGRHAGGPVLVRIEAREMLADDFRRRIALEPLGPGVPADHPAVGVEHVDGVVGNGVDQQPVAVLIVNRIASCLRHLTPLLAPAQACGGTTTSAAVLFPRRADQTLVRRRS